MKKYDCDRCSNGIIERYMHIDNGICYKCNGTGKLNYNPIIYGMEQNNLEWNDYEKFEIEAEQEMIKQAEIENWMYANNIEYGDNLLDS